MHRAKRATNRQERFFLSEQKIEPKMTLCCYLKNFGAMNDLKVVTYCKIAVFMINR